MISGIYGIVFFCVGISWFDYFKLTSFLKGHFIGFSVNLDRAEWKEKYILKLLSTLAWLYLNVSRQYHGF